MEIVTMSVLVLVIVLFIVGFMEVAGALAGSDEAAQGIARSSSARIEQISSQGRKAMDELSDAYLDQLYDEITYSEKGGR